MNRNEQARRFFHLLGLAIPFGYWSVEERLFLPLFYIAAALIAGIEMARLKIEAAAALYNRLFKGLLRPRELTHFSGAFFFAIGASLAVALFPKDVAVSSLLVLSLADPAAAAIGGRYGKIRLLGKTLEGSLAFFLFAFLILGLYNPLGGSILKYILPALAGTLAELYPGRLNDNLTIPLVVGAALILVL